MYEVVYDETKIPIFRKGLIIWRPNYAKLRYVLGSKVGRSAFHIPRVDYSRDPSRNGDAVK